jgi:restriction endonuclease S subunit
VVKLKNFYRKNWLRLQSFQERETAGMNKTILPKGWKIVKLKKIVTPIDEKAGDKILETLSISAGIGFVNQAEKFGKELSGAQYVNYTVIKKGDFSFNKGNSKKFPYGCIYRLKDRDIAAVPNAFFSFCIKDQCDEFFEQLFISGYLNHQLNKVINTGVRNDGLFNLYKNDFYNCTVPIPPPHEQQAIAEILITADKLITAKERLIATKQKQKQWLMQNLLTSKIHLQGFGEKWKKIPFSELFTANTIYTDDINNIPLYSLTIENGVTKKTERYERSHLVLKDEAYKVVYQNDYVYNPMNIRFGAVARYKGSIPVSVSGYYDIFRCNNEEDCNFFDNYLVSPFMISYYNKVSTGSLVEKK